MNKAEREYIKQCEVWFKGQELAIKSCDVNIDHLERQIKINREIIRMEKKEKAMKIRLLESVKKEFNKVRRKK